MIDPALLSHLTAEASSDGVAQLVVGAVVAHEGNVLLLKPPRWSSRRPGFGRSPGLAWLQRTVES